MPPISRVVVALRAAMPRTTLLSGAGIDKNTFSSDVTPRITGSIPPCAIEISCSPAASAELENKSTAPLNPPCIAIAARSTEPANPSI